MAEIRNPLKDKLNDDELDLSICSYADKDVPVKDIALLKRATKLDLSNNKLTGLPKSFATLTHLVKLDLSCNLIAELPANFGELHRLKHLDLYNNKLSHLPVSFHQLTSLRWLDLKNNQLSSQLSAAAGECLNPKECEQCARRVVQFMGRVKEHYDQERIRQEQQKKELMQKKLAAEEAEKERLRLEKKAKKEKKKQELRERKIENLHHHHPDDKEHKEASPPETKTASSLKAKNAGGLSFVAKLNILLLLTTVALVGGALYLHRSSDSSNAGLRANLYALSSLARQQAGRAFDALLQAFKHVSDLGTSAGDALVSRTLVAWHWSAEWAARLDLYLTKTLGEPWLATKNVVGGACQTLARYSRLAGERALVLGSYAVRRGWEAAGPLWDVICERSAAAKVWALDAAARLQENAGPVLLEWAAAAQRAAADAWAVVQREAPGYAAAAWDLTCRATQELWRLCGVGWELARTEVPVYAGLAAERVTSFLASLTGQV